MLRGFHCRIEWQHNRQIQVQVVRQARRDIGMRAAMVMVLHPLLTDQMNNNTDSLISQ